MNFTGYVDKLSTEKFSNWAKAMAGEWQSCDLNPGASGIKAHPFGRLRTTKSNTLADLSLRSFLSPDPDLGFFRMMIPKSKGEAICFTRTTMLPRSGSTINYSPDVSDVLRS